MTEEKQTEQPANENERRSEDELWKEFLNVSFYNMLRSEDASDRQREASGMFPPDKRKNHPFDRLLMGRRTRK